MLETTGEVRSIRRLLIAERRRAGADAGEYLMLMTTESQTCRDELIRELNATGVPVKPSRKCSMVAFLRIGHSEMSISELLGVGFIRGRLGVNTFGEILTAAEAREAFCSFAQHHA